MCYAWEVSPAVVVCATDTHVTEVHGTSLGLLHSALAMCQVQCQTLSLPHPGQFLYLTYHYVTDGEIKAQPLNLLKPT